MNILLLVTALSLSAIAAWYAIVGLTAIFASAVIPIIIMGSALEISKLVLASWIYRNWKQVPFLMKSYFTAALFVLMTLTSMGIFGYLSKAHLDQTMVTGDNGLQIELLDNRISRQQQRIDDSEVVLGQLDTAVQTLMEYDRIRGKDGAIAVRESQKEERSTLTSVIDDASDQIAKLRNEKLVLQKEQIALEAEVGPIRYVAALLYGDELNASLLESAVRIVIIMIVIVFDPLAVIMLIAANWSLARKITSKEIIPPSFSPAPMTNFREAVQEVQPKERKKPKRESKPSPADLELFLEDQVNPQDDFNFEQRGWPDTKKWLLKDK